ncbi:transducin beta-like protein 3 [Lineus longissimus]|uniref:transducin beta-like protein 3 n=1 Tax=Lineus longissimus TaxID=88925 RepID=UPI002B4F25B3
MASTLKTNLSVAKKYDAFYTGGKVQFSKSGEHLFCVCGVVVKVLDVQTGELCQTIGKEEDPEVTCFALSPDDGALVVASQNSLLRQYNWKENIVQRTWKAIHMGPVTSMTFDCTSTLLATGGSDATIKVWDIIKQYVTHNLKGHVGVVRVVEFHPDISRLQLFSGSDDYKVRMWDLQSSSCLAVFEGHYSMVTSISFTQDGHSILSSGRDNVVIVWDLVNKKKEKVIPVYESVESVIMLKQDKAYPSLNVSSGGVHFITAGAKGVLKVWNAMTSRCVFTQPKHEEIEEETEETEDKKEEEKVNENAITSAQFIKETNTLAVVTFQHNILLYNVDDFFLKKQFAGYNDDILDLKFLGKEDEYLAVATNSELIKVFNTKTWSCQILKGHTDIVMCLDVHKKGEYLASCSKDKTVRLWSVDTDNITLKCISVGLGHTHAINAVAFSKLGLNFLVTGGEDLTLKLWALNETDGDLQLSPKMTEKVHEKDINSICVAPNDKLIATGSQDKLAKLWSSTDLALLGVFRGHKRGIWCVQFSPVDQALVTSSGDGNIKIWSLTDFSCVKTFEGHETSVLRVSFMSRGMQLISTGSDGLVKLWTIKNNECVKTMDEHEDKIWAMAVSPGEDRLVTGGADSNIILWKDTTEEDLEEVRAKQEDIILKEQKLMNFLHEKKFLKAIGLAITLEQPFRVLSILKQILGEPEGDQQLEITLKKLRVDQIDAVLRFAVEWNTNSKHCHEAQFVLNTVLKQYSPEEILELPNIKSTLEGLIPYTERHFQRMNRLQQQATFVGYTRQCMKIVSLPESSEDRMEVGSPQFVVDRSAKMDSSLEISDEELTQKQGGVSCSESSEEEMEVDDSGCESDQAVTRQNKPKKQKTLPASEENEKDDIEELCVEHVESVGAKTVKNKKAKTPSRLGEDLKSTAVQGAAKKRLKQSKSKRRR